MPEDGSLLDILPVLTIPAKRFVRKPVIRRESNVASSISLQKIHEDSERRLSSLNSENYDKFRRSTGRIDNKEELKTLSGLVLEKARQSSISAKKIDVAATTKNIASKFDAVNDSDLLTESINAIINQLGQGAGHFENGDLFEYVRLVFKKSKFEIDKLINTLKERNESAHSLQIMLERANLKRPPKSSSFCSMTLKKLHEATHFSLCNDNNTVLSTLCGSQSPLWDANLALPLETTKGYSLVVAIWETKSNTSMAIINEGKKCMGLVEIDLHSEPMSGTEAYKWWDLSSAKKPTKVNKKNGRVHLGLRYNTEVGRHSNAVMVHAGMLSKFLSVDYPRTGCLSGVAAHILELQKIQQKLSPDEFRFVDWLVRVELYVKTNSHFELLHRVLVLLQVCVNKPVPDLSEEYLLRLWETFTDFQGKYIETMGNLNGEFPYTSETSLVDLKYFTKCYLGMLDIPRYAERHAPVVKQGKVELGNSFKKNHTRWITSITHPFTTQPEDPLRERAQKVKDMTNAVRIELKNESTTYAPALVGTPYKTTILYQINEKVSNVVVDIISEIISHLKSSETDDEDLLNDCLALYVAVADLKKLSCELDPDTEHALKHFHSWFYSVIETWLQMVQIKQQIRVSKSVQFDKLERIDMHVPYSTCVVDVETMNNHLCEIQDIFDFPDESSRYSVISKLTKQALDSAVQLAETLAEKGKGILDKVGKKFGENRLSYEETLKKCLVLACSLDKAGSNLQFLAAQLSWDQLSVSLVEKLSSKRNEAFDLILKYRVTWMVTTCEKLIEPKFVVAFISFIKLVYSRENDAVEELLKMLEEDLNKISSNTEPDVFEGFLKVIWERVVLPQFHQHIDTKPTKIQNYYDILQESFRDLSDFFVAEMLSKGNIITQNHEYKKLLYILENLTIPLEELLFRHFVEEMVQQSQQHTDLGYVNFTAFLTQQHDKTLLMVTIVSCSGLPIMDTLGSCDAVVKVTLQPRQSSHFSHVKILKTKAMYNNLDPVFNQEFTFSFYCDPDKLNDGASLHLTVWDKDKFSADDFIGEVLVNMNSIPFDSPQEFKEPLVLPDLTSLSYDAIRHRGPYEKNAEKFVKERSNLVNDAGEDFVTKRGSALKIFHEITERLHKNSDESSRRKLPVL